MPAIAHRFLRPLAVTVVLGLGLGVAVAQADLRFDRLTPADGLSQVSGNAVIQDSEGFLWIGTQDGLNRYDGRDFVIHKNSAGDPDSLWDNFVNAIWEDSQDRLWILTNSPGAINRYDPETEEILTFRLQPSDEGAPPVRAVNVKALWEDEAGNLWIGTFGSGIFVLDQETGETEHLYALADRNGGLSSNAISSIFEDSTGTVWIGTFGGGLYRRVAGADGSSGELIHYANDPDDSDSLAHDTVTDLYEDSTGVLWVATGGGGLDRLERDAGRFVHLRAEGAETSGLAGNVIPGNQRPILEDSKGYLWVYTTQGLTRLDPDRQRSRHYRPDPTTIASPVSMLYEDGSGGLWVGTLGSGVFLYDRKHDDFAQFTLDPSDPQSLSSNGVLSIFEDRSGIVWFGTANGGAASFSRNKHRFDWLRQSPVDPDSLSDSKVFAIALDRNDGLWVGTLEGGVHRFDRRRDRVVERYSALPGNPRDIGNVGVRAVYEDHLGNLWVGTQGAGLSLIDRAGGSESQRFSFDPNDATSLSNNVISSIFEDSHGRLWVGTGFGLNLMDRRTGTFTRFMNDPDDATSLPNNFARFVYQGPSGDLWVGTGGGFARFDSATGAFETFVRRPDDPTSLANGSVMDLREDGEGGIWVATYGGGLDHCSISTGACTHFTTADGLPTDSIYTAIPDEDGFLWISSNQGISRFDPRTREIRNYDASDGLGGNEFNGRSYFVADDGEMFFGGMHGVTSFFPGRTRDSEFLPPVVITAFRRFGEVEDFDQAVHRVGRIELTHRDSFFSFEFAALDFGNPDKTQYEYKLEGFDEDWVSSGRRRFASYTNLDGGTYSFRVRGTNVDGAWSEMAQPLEVVVVPPPWKTWWAYTLYVLAAVGGVFGYSRYRALAHRAELRSAREEAESQRLLAERLQQIDTMKDEFLANTSHELRTPLNGIIGLADSLRDGATGELPSDTRSNLFMIAASGRRLSRLVDDILDFSKLKSHELELHRGAVGMREVVDIVLTLSKPLIAERDLLLVNEVPGDLPAVDGDENRLQQILHNLVGNAIKFTDSGTITAGGRATEGRIEITISDTGVGIPSENLATIFESFEQVDASAARSVGGTGLGLTITRQLVELHGGSIAVESEEGVGSVFTISLPTADPSSEASTGEAAQSLFRQAVAVAEEAAIIEASGDLGALRVEPSTNGHGNLEGVKVLSVDDDPINLQVLHNILSLEGCELTEATDGERGLALVEEGYVPDVVLLDVMMPRLTGFEVCQRLRESFSGNELPVILLTAKNQVSDLVQGLASGANDYLTKPFTKSELLARINTHLSLSRAHTVEAENKRKAEELQHARAIQLSLLPQEMPDVPYLDIAVHMSTATEVGGDYYDFFPQTDGGLYVATGDATGHGISAGMMVAMTKSTIKALDVQSPHVLLMQANRVIRAVNPQNMTMALNALTISDSGFAVSSAGMPPLFLYRGDRAEVEEILVPGLPLGAMAESEYTLRVVEFKRGDSLVLISDGLPELRNEAGEPLGYAAVQRTVAEHGEAGPEELLAELTTLGERWQGDRPSDDDITVVVIKRI